MAKDERRLKSRIYRRVKPKTLKKIAGLLFSLDGGMLASETLLLAKSGWVSGQSWRSHGVAMSYSLDWASIIQDVARRCARYRSYWHWTFSQRQALYIVHQLSSKPIHGQYKSLYSASFGRNCCPSGTVSPFSVRSLTFIRRLKLTLYILPPFALPQNRSTASTQVSNYHPPSLLCLFFTQLILPWASSIPWSTLTSWAVIMDGCSLWSSWASLF